MSQSGFIAAMLLAAFVLWLAINDRLQTYTAVLFGPTQQPTPTGNLYVPGTAGGIEGPEDGQPQTNKSGGGGGIVASILGGVKPILGGGSGATSLGDFLNSLELDPSTVLEAATAGG